MRTEKDLLGEVVLPDDCLWGVNTERSRLNFQISSFQLPFEFIQAIALIKKHYVVSAAKVGLLEEKLAQAIQSAADEILEGKHQEQFPLDVFQTGSGTSTNMNVNEVLKNRAMQLVSDVSIHPNDHVNIAQSSNDVIPSAINIASLLTFKKVLAPEILEFISALERKEQEFISVVKLGRTHLQDAVPLTVAQEISGWRSQLKWALDNLNLLANELQKLTLGGTAVGTGLNCPPELLGLVYQGLSEETGLNFVRTDNHFASQSSVNIPLSFSMGLQRFAWSVFKFANDLRFLSSGPQGGYGEYAIASLQAGSSIMPGKVNPVALESALMVCFFAVGLGHAISLGETVSNFQLNTSLPLIAFCLLTKIKLLSNTARNLTEKVLTDLSIDEARCFDLAQKSPSLATPLTRYLGYDQTAKIVKHSIENKITLRQAIQDFGVSLPDLDEILDPSKLI